MRAGSGYRILRQSGEWLWRTGKQQGGAVLLARGVSMMIGGLVVLMIAQVLHQSRSAYAEDGVVDPCQPMVGMVEVDPCRVNSVSDGSATVPATEPTTAQVTAQATVQRVAPATDSASTVSVAIPGLEEAMVTPTPLLDPNVYTATHLSLQACIHRALAHNLDIRVESFSPAIRMADLVEAEAAFDAVLYGNAQHQNLDDNNIDSTFITRTVTTPGGVETIRVPTEPYSRGHDTTYALGLRKRLPTGAVVELAQELRRYRSLDLDADRLYRNPFYQYTLGIELSQPLLRDFGIDVNRASINASRNAVGISHQQLQLQVTDTVAQVEQAYWSLVFLRQRVRVYEALLGRARQTQELLTYRMELEAGALSIHRNVGLVQRSLANVVTAQNDVIQQQQRLLALLNDPALDIREDWEIIPTDQPSTQGYDVEKSQALELALALRPEIIAQQLRVDTAGIARGLAENQKLPRLDLTARQEFSGAGETAGTAWDNQNEMDTMSTQVGLSFEVPLGGNRAARAAVSRARHQQQQELARLENVRQQVTADVHIALSALRSTFQELTVRHRAAQAEADTLEAFLAEQEAGVPLTASFLDRQLDAEERLANSQILAAQSILEYNIAIMKLQQARGTLLHYDNIRITEMPDLK